MESQDVIDSLRAQLAQVEEQGNTQVQVSALLAYLSALEKDSDTSSAYREQQHAGMLAHYAAHNQQNIEMLKATLEAGKSALHSLLIINGGAVIALLGVLSNLVGKPNGALLAGYLALPLIQFGLGVLCGGLGFALRYFSQDCYGNASETNRYENWGHGFKYAAVVSALLGYLLFGFAITNAYHAIEWSF